MTKRNPLLDAALILVDLGYPVFPCLPGRKVPLTEHGFKDATTDPEQIEAWWTETPDANVAVPTHSLLVVDIDDPDTPWLSAPGVDLAPGAVSLTPGGGRHLVYRRPQGKVWRNTASRLAPHVDTRSEGGYIVLPPSETGDGTYTWVEGHALDVGVSELPEPPQWLTEQLDALAAGPPVPAKAAPEPPGEPTKAPPRPLVQDGHPIPPGQRNDTLARLAGLMRRGGMTEPEIRAALLVTNAQRCQPPLPDAEVEKIAWSVARYEPDQITVGMMEDHWGQLQSEAERPTGPRSVRQLTSSFPSLREPVIGGLLREGETMNVISAPKIGKSWLVTDLALSVGTGRRWLERFETVQGEVLIIDNELHPETSANRIPKVAHARGMSLEDVSDRVYVQNLRGHLQDLRSLGTYFQQFEPGRFKMVILDAFYRFLPISADENDNGTMANLYNYLDSFADRLKCCFVLIHHTSKGDQSFKTVTDVGAGAGAQSRATDTHLILRRHEEEDAVVLQAAVRSWPAVEPFVLRWAFPVWTPAEELDPARLRTSGPRSKRKKREAIAEQTEPKWTPQAFAEAFVGEKPKLKHAILGNANDAGLSGNRAKNLLGQAEALGIVHRWRMEGNRAGYATVPQPECVEKGATTPSKRPKIETILQAQPDLAAKEIAAQVGASPQYVNRIRQQVS